MTDHPLTDEICADILPKRSLGLCNLSEIHLNTRVLGEVRHCNDMRAAADWQLEQCINELNGVLSLFQLSGKITEAERLSLLNVFKNAMRPQEES